LGFPPIPVVPCGLAVTLWGFDSRRRRRDVFRRLFADIAIVDDVDGLPLALPVGSVGEVLDGTV
jgi:hypothetical protein